MNHDAQQIRLLRGWANEMEADVSSTDSYAYD